jgi:hypothetical protein
MANEKKKKLHIARVPYTGTAVLTKCGRKKNTGHFTNPNAKLCPQCVALAEADGLDVEMTWTGDHWRVKADPPQLELVTKSGMSAIVDRNDPEALPVYLTHDRLEYALGDQTMQDLWFTHGPQPELTQ